MLASTTRQIEGQAGVPREWAAQRIGGTLAVVGGLGYFITLLLHGDLPANSGCNAT